ncbi:MAG: hypothetical protein AUJ49_06165 [Desulfovibrionaceae bacterium CG1_02_65_16]|nr:MAG: hypothetical protein AUJ49_06165 [Desulfovibrionaceae bacterium CG1_02_65_16]
MRTALSIRLKLLLLALLASLPALGLALYTGISEEHQAVRAAEQKAGHLVLDLAQRQQQLIASTRQFLATLTLLPAVRKLDGEASAPLFRALLAANPIYSDIVLSNAQGKILASARTHAPNFNLSMIPYFAEVVRTKDFTIGGYRKSITTGLDILVCAHPVLNQRGEILGVVSMGLRLSIFSDIAQGIQLPDGSTVVVADHDGRRLFNRHFPYPRPDLYPLGGPINLSQRQKLKGAAQASPFYAEDMRGTLRLYVVRELRQRPQDPPYLYVGISLPQRTIIGQARRDMVASLSILLVAALLTALAAWLAGRQMFVKRIELLARLAARFASGDLTARTGLPAHSAERDELGQLATAMDRIGEELSAREAEREATLERLARTQFAVDNAGNEIYWADGRGRLLYVNRRAAESLGYTPEELTGRLLFDIDTSFTPETWRQLLDQLAEKGPRTIETHQRARSGVIKPKELNISLVDGAEARLVYGSGIDVTDRKRQEAVLRSLLDETAAATGEAFFQAFTARLVSILGVTAAFIGEYLDDPPTRVRSLSFSGDADDSQKEFFLSETPGRLIPDNGFLLLREGARQRHPESTLIVQCGIESYLGVPMHNAAGRRIGHLSIMDRRPMPDDPGLISTLRLFAQRASAEVMRLRAERDMLASLKEKEVLLKEIHHRVKNNMQIVSSLLSLQARDVTDPAVLGLLAESRARILSMALVHEDLYQSGDLAQVDFRRYLERLAGRTRTSMAEASGVAIELDLDALALSIDQAIPLGLICNELLTNALKHAFPGGKGGVVRIMLRDERKARAATAGTAGIVETAGRPQASLTVRDNGQGLPADLIPGEGGTLGLELVWSLAGQLHGQASAHNDGGAVFTVRFPMNS